MSNFSTLKANSGKKSLETLTAELAKVAGNQESKGADERFWTPTVDKAQNGYAVIRFLPAPPDEDVPFIRMFDHGFQGPTGLWYIENSLTTIGKQDPVSEYNSKLWNSTTDDKSPERTQARKQKRRLHYISNIYVVTDQGNPSNEGKVFLFKYGKKIFDKLNEAMNPQFADEKPMNPFDLWAGANFKLKIRQVDGYRNYDKSEFDSIKPLLNDDEELEKVWKSEHSLKEFLEPKNFKSYEELQSRLLKVLDDAETPKNKVARAEEEDLPWAREDEAPKFKESAPAKRPAADYAADEEDEDDLMAHFKSLAR
jgi:hypothetical protein